ncbi:threonine synthase [Thermoflexus sp.]|uniref:threonine synthase n=1 Tax=Thermoflexus sp. TaxID=1969742 RepID=UPI0025FF52C8|nr:threonine synthase [Thermoflexus sp.]MCS6963248.1 threonine synthase [Thermoflexus sp.]MCX7691233.1 threonine synthase [Thermoflexus sp.]MDW8064161.1 threonine synthase [Anaerolineae bacterium]MDW8184985.1 threonine synthase [Anaerolineae bacterium]
MADGSIWRGVIHAYRPFLQIAPIDPVTLYEGNTPLLPAPRLAQAIGFHGSLYLKYEGLNPTGSFKDRGMTAAITQAVAEGAQAVICASTGNTAASAAAYAARAGLQALVLIPAGKIALGKLAAAMAYGATVLAVEGNFDEALALVRRAVEVYPIALVNSLNPYRLEGQQTAAFEICDQLRRAPDWLCIPVGNAGNITAYWKGFRAYHQAGRIDGLPHLLGVQAEGAAPLVLGHPVDHPETIATAIRIGRPARGPEALQAVRESGGRLLAVSDAEILEAWRMLAALEGLFVEPASAASIAGLRRALAQGLIPSSEGTIVAVLTGHGLKDPEIALRTLSPPITISAEWDAFRRALEPILENPLARSERLPFPS